MCASVYNMCMLLLSPMLCHAMLSLERGMDGVLMGSEFGVGVNWFGWVGGLHLPL